MASVQRIGRSSAGLSLLAAVWLAVVAAGCGNPSCRPIEALAAPPTC